jgi:regulator of PEP synthase PpsR (kinase-PPPase family)
LKTFVQATNPATLGTARVPSSRFETSQLDRALSEIEEAPGIVLFTLLEKDLVARPEAKCQEINLPSLSIIGPVMQLFNAYLGAPTTGRLGAQQQWRYRTWCSG